MQLGTQKNQTDSFFFLAYQRQVLSFVYNCSQFFTFSEFSFTALFMLSVFVTYLLMFSTNYHVFDNFSCFCCHVFILRAGLRFPDGKLVLLPRRPNTNIPPEKLEIYFHKYRNMKSNANLQNRNRNVYFDKNIFQNLRNLTQFCFVSSGPQLQKVSWSRFCSHVFQFIFPSGI